MSKVISAILTLKDQNFASGMRKADRQMSDFGRSASVVKNKVDDFKRSTTDAFKQVGKASVAMAAAGVTALGASVAKTVLEMDSSFAKLQAQTGAMGADLQALEGAAKDTFARGFGESLDEVTTAVSRVKQNMKGLDNGEISKVTSNAMLLANTFDSDVNEVTRGVNNTMDAFGISADKAFDLFTAGGQRGLNFSNEMFDNVAEYSSLFGAMGYSAEEYFGILERGSQSGVYNLDYVNDIMKEFQIRVKDGSKSTNEAMKSMSKSTQNVWKEYLKGNGTVKDVASTVVNELKNMDDQVLAGQLGVSLMGTKFEDLESDAVYAMLGTTNAMKNFEGATDSASSKVEGSIKNRLVSSWRDLQLSIADVVNSSGAQQFLGDVATKADELIPKVVDLVEKAFELGNTVKTHWTPITETIIGITTAFLAYKTAVTVVTAAQWAMNASLVANPVGLVITLIAGLTAGVVLLYRNSDKFRQGWDNTWSSIKSGTASGVNFVIEKINDLINVLNKIPGVNIPIVPKVQWGNVHAGSKEVYSANPSMKSAPQMASFDVGSNRITHDQVAQIHKGEMIIPARQAQKVRQAGGTIDNIDSLITKPNQAATSNLNGNQSPNNQSSNGGFSIGSLTVNAKGVTVTEVINELIPQLKLALANQ